jgi:hypothetical protein
LKLLTKIIRQNVQLNAALRDGASSNPYTSMQKNFHNFFFIQWMAWMVVAYQISEATLIIIPRPS